MLAREYCDQTKPKIKFKPVIISHHMLLGLKEGQEKMSKSDPDSAIFMEDAAADVKRKIKKAFCPPGQCDKNPIIDYSEHIIINYIGKLDITDYEKKVTTYTDAAVLKADYEAEKVHPGDLKAAVGDALNAILEPVRKHFASGEPARLLKQVKGYKVTK
jgi:tyrosyl-tRNA synthetase